MTSIIASSSEAKANDINYYSNPVAAINSALLDGNYALAKEILLGAEDLIHPLLFKQKARELHSVDKSSGRVFVDITDYVIFFLHRSVVSGIQRVVHGLIKHSQYLCDQGRQVIFCMTHPVSGLFSEISSARIDELVYAVELHEHADSIRMAAEGILSHCKFKEHSTLCPWDTLLIPGGPWATSVQLLIYLRDKELARFNAFAVCYDIIPIQCPEFCSIGLTNVFKNAYLQLLSLVDGYISISKFTSKSIREYELSRGLNRDTCFYQDWRLGDFDEYKIEENPANPSLATNIDQLSCKGFVLYVSTIEPRKNHLNLLRAWRLVSNRLGSECTMPILVFAGKHGWNSSDIKHQLEALNLSGITILCLEDMTDSSIDWLYNNCLFSVMPSFIEGWGLSITESLMHGKVCLTSTSSSMPEAASGLCPLFDPYNISELANRLYELICGNDLAHYEEMIQGYRPVSWKSSAGSFYSKLLEMDSKRLYGLGVPRPSMQILQCDLLEIDADKETVYHPHDSHKWSHFVPWSWYSPELGGRLRSYGSHSYVNLNITPCDDPLVLCIQLEAMPSVAISECTACFLSASADTCLVELIHSDGNDDLVLLMISCASQKTNEILSVSIRANKSLPVLPPQDPRISAFSLLSISASTSTRK